MTMRYFSAREVVKTTYWPIRPADEMYNTKAQRSRFVGEHRQREAQFQGEWCRNPLVKVNEYTNTTFCFVLRTLFSCPEGASYETLHR